MQDRETQASIAAAPAKNRTATGCLVRTGLVGASCHSYFQWIRSLPGPDYKARSGTLPLGLFMLSFSQCLTRKTSLSFRLFCFAYAYWWFWVLHLSCIQSESIWKINRKPRKFHHVVIPCVLRFLVVCLLPSFPAFLPSANGTLSGYFWSLLSLSNGHIPGYFIAFIEEHRRTYYSIPTFSKMGQDNLLRK